jgi:hypothetical protein
MAELPLNFMLHLGEKAVLILEAMEEVLMMMMESVLKRSLSFEPEEERKLEIFHLFVNTI